MFLLQTIFTKATTSFIYELFFKNSTESFNQGIFLLQSLLKGISKSPWKGRKYNINLLWYKIEIQAYFCIIFIFLGLLEVPSCGLYGCSYIYHYGYRYTLTSTMRYESYYIVTTKWAESVYIHIIMFFFIFIPNV